MRFPLVELKDCCTVIGGATPKREIKENWSKDIPWVTPKDISNLDAPVLEDAPEYISQAGFDSCSTYMLPKGTILLTSRAPIGNVAIAGREICTNQGFKSLIPGEGIDSIYLYYCIKYLSSRLQALGNGATFKEISKKIVETFKIPLPPLEEQKRIAAILDKADAIRRKRQQAIKLADQFLRSVFLDMFGNPVTNPKGWKLEPLGNHLDFVTSGSRAWAKYYSDSGALFIRSLDVQMNELVFEDTAYVVPPESAEANRTLVKKGDVLLTITGSRIGRVAPVISDIGRAHVSQHVAILRPRETLLAEFLSMYLSDSKGGQLQIKKCFYGQTKPGLNLEQIKDFIVPIPEIKMQERFLKLREKFQFNLAKFDQAKELKKYLMGSLTKNAFNGELTKSKIAQ